jgi:hypothetical protein
LNWRSKRGYFLVDRFQIYDNFFDPVSPLASQRIVKLSGYLKNTWGPENHGHITGISDFHSMQVEGDVEVKLKSIARLVKVAKDVDDWRVFNSNSSEMIIEKPEITTIDAQVDEFQDLKRQFELLKFDQNQGPLIRRKQLQSTSN